MRHSKLALLGAFLFVITGAAPAAPPAVSPAAPPMSAPPSLRQPTAPPASPAPYQSTSQLYDQASSSSPLFGKAGGLLHGGLGVPKTSDGSGDITELLMALLKGQ
mgnify:CR=1 FL=1